MLNFLTGGAVSLATELIKGIASYKQDKSDKRHELELAKLQAELSRENNEITIANIDNNSEIERYKTIGKTFKSGIKIVDFLNGIIRPVWGIVCLVLFIKLTFFAINLYISTDTIYSNSDAYELVLGRIAYFDSICDSVIGFFFVKRSFQK